MGTQRQCVWLFLLMGIAPLHPAQAQTPARSEVPIREVVLSDGTRRYGIPITVGGTQIEAGLDTGSTGLRVLPNVLAAADATGGGHDDRYSYGAGTEFTGEIGKGQLGIGGLAAISTLQLIHGVDCVQSNPHCPASRVSLAQFGVQGNGLAGEGFRAIIGVNMAEADVASPLTALGAKRWIVELPRPGSGIPGKLVLNPTDEELKDYVRLPVLRVFAAQRGGLHDAVSGCLINVTTKDKSCGATMMDTGAPGITLTNGTLGHTAWDNGTPAALALFDANAARAVAYFTVGLREHASRLSFEEKPQPRQTVIYAGLTPYFAFDVLYDPAGGEIGVRPRPSASGAPSGQLAPSNEAAHAAGRE
jgi:hypothetical protein